MFESEALEQLNLKGFSTPVRAFRITAELSSLDRRDGEFSHRPSPLVGRGVELALLDDRWAKSREGHGQIVLIGAEPGVGKSRLLHEFRRKVSDEPHVYVALHCSPYQANSTLFPVIDVIERQLKLAKDAGDVARLDALEHWIDALSLSRAEYVPLLAALLEIPFESGYAALDLSAEQRRRKTLEALVRLIEAQVVDKPMLLVAEDLHWVDPTTEMFLGRIVEIAKNSPINMLLTQRPEYAAPWGSEPHLTEVRLNHLTRSECRSLIGNIAAAAGLSKSLMENIAERTDGVPLFVEELSKAMVESQGSDTIPASLRDALTARLDLLGSAKEVAQAASVLGREFSSELLPVILHVPKEQIDEGLDALVSSGLVNSIRPVPTGDHQFKHALVRDAAYESLLRPARQQLHQRAADALGKLAPPARPATIAHRLEQAGALEEATERWKQAGEEAARRWAHAEAAAHFRHALELAEMSGFAAQPRIRLVIRLAYTLHLNGERAQADALMASNSAQIPDVRSLSAVGWFFSAWAEISSFLGKREEAWSYCEKALEAGRESGDGQLIATALVGLSTEDAFTERFRQILERNEEALALFSGQPSLVWEADSALNRCLLTLGLAAVRLGEIDKARAALVRVAQIRERLPRSLSERGSGIPALVGIALARILHETGAA